MLATSLGLPAACFNFKDELAAAWAGNHYQSARLDKPAVAKALREFWQRKKASLIGTALDSFLAVRYPALFRPVTSPGSFGTPSAPNERQGKIHPLSGTTAQERLAGNEAGVILGIGPEMRSFN